MRGWALVLGGSVVAMALAAGAGAATSGDHQGDASCEVDAATLRVEAASTDVRLRRQGAQRIAVFADEARLECSGPDATVGTIDTIEVGDDSHLIVDLRGGPLAPGLTPEDDGSSEIEIEHLEGASHEIDIRMGRGPSEVAVGRVGRDAGINFNVGAERGNGRDVDLTLHRTELFGLDAFVVVFGGPGADVIGARGGPEFSGRYEARFPGLGFAVGGGRGRDVLLGGPGMDILFGGPQRDVLKAGRGADIVASVGIGRRGRLDSGVADGRDRVDCGPGRDTAFVDRHDWVRRCNDRIRLTGEPARQSLSAPSSPRAAEPLPRLLGRLGG